MAKKTGGGPCEGCGGPTDNAPEVREKLIIIIFLFLFLFLLLFGLGFFLFVESLTF